MAAVHSLQSGRSKRLHYSTKISKNIIKNISKCFQNTEECNSAAVKLKCPPKFFEQSRIGARVESRLLALGETPSIEIGLEQDFTMANIQYHL